jgi:hypothetical protein
MKDIDALESCKEDCTKMQKLQVIEMFMNVNRLNKFLKDDKIFKRIFLTL